MIFCTLSSPMEPLLLWKNFASMRLKLRSMEARNEAFWVNFFVIACAVGSWPSIA